jgi:photosystem II stability/assembly factor-like uncharacterized protein
MMKQILFVIAFTCTVAGSFAQRKVPAELQTRLEGKTKVRDIMREVESYYDSGRRYVPSNSIQEFESNNYHWWKKWEYWAMRRMNADGKIADYKWKNYQALQSVESSFAAELLKARADFHKSKTTGANRDAEGNRSDGSTRSYGGWSENGPYNGGAIVGTGTNIDINGVARMDRITFSPTDPLKLYVCSPTGSLYSTSDGGSNWYNIGTGLPAGISCLEIAPSNQYVLYAFSGDGDSHYPGTFVMNYLYSPSSKGVFKSTTGGNTWVKLSDMYTGAGDLVGRQLAISPTNQNYLYAATNVGLYRTTNGGLSWEQVRSGNHWDVEFKPHDDSTVYASTSSGIVYSTSGGRTGTWNNSTFDFSFTDKRVDIAVRNNITNTQSTYVYALVGGATAGAFTGLFRSTNSGVSFSRRTNTPNILGSTVAGTDDNDQSTYDLGVCVKPSDDNYVVTGGLCVWRSNGSNGGSSMVSSSTYRESLGAATSYIHPDIHDVQYNPLDNVLYACTDGGVYKSANDGQTWSNISNGLDGSQFYHMRMKDVDGDGLSDGTDMICGAQDNGIKYRNASGNWIHLICCDGYDGMVKGSNSNHMVMNINDNMYRTTNGGSSLSFLFSSSFFNPMAIDHDFDDTMYIATTQGLRRSYNGFSTNTTLPFNLNNFIITCPSNNARIYGGVGNRYQLARSDDRGANWTIISGNTGWPSTNPTITSCAPSLTNANEIFVTIAGYIDTSKVLRSTDAGVTWNNYTANLPNVPVHCIATSPEGVYIGTDIGVFFRVTGASVWRPFYTGMPNIAVTDLSVNENGMLYASTFGRGIWSTERYSPCSPVVNVSGLLNGNHYYEAENTVNVTGSSYSGPISNIFVKSNGYIDLLEGFHIRSGSFFQGYIGPCGTGIPVPSANEPGFRGPDISRIVEYDDKMQALRRKQTSSYYTFVADGIELNLDSDQVVNIVIADANNDVTTLVNNVALGKGMYKVITGPGNFVPKVFVGSVEAQKL